MKATLSFRQRAKLAMKILSKQPPVSLEEMKKQFNRSKKKGEKQFAKEAPKIEEQLKLIQSPLSFTDTVHIYRWLCRKQITINMIPKEILKEFKNTEQYEGFINRK